VGFGAGAGVAAMTPETKATKVSNATRKIIFFILFHLLLLGDFSKSKNRRSKMSANDSPECVVCNLFK
jgi:hypothetical protein